MFLKTKFATWIAVPRDLISRMEWRDIDGVKFALYPDPWSVPRAIKLTETINNDFILEVRYLGIDKEPVTASENKHGVWFKGENSHRIHQIKFHNERFLRQWLQVTGNGLSNDQMTRESVLKLLCERLTA